MKINIVLKPRAVRTRPCTIVLPPERIPIDDRFPGMLMFEDDQTLREKHSLFWGILQTFDRPASDPVQLTAPLLRQLRDRLGLWIEADDVPLAAALLNLDERDPIFACPGS